ncbi:hypothetical protein [Azospirillum sp.]|uniref:hypothetical protein n=1 Tax=Azospirillum sp. TaxID=34012 RepID=UPI003D751576
MRLIQFTTRRVSALAFGAALLGGCQTALKKAVVPGEPVALAPAAFRCPPMGTVVEYEAGRTITYLAQEQPDACLITNGARTQSMIYNLVPADRRAADALRSVLSKLWPLQVGKAVTSERDPFLTGNDDIDAKFVTGVDETITVLRSERLITPAGTFDTYVIERAYTSLYGNSAGRYYYWYEPQNGLLLKGLYERDSGVNKVRAPNMTAQRVQVGAGHSQ